MARHVEPAAEAVESAAVDVVGKGPDINEIETRAGGERESEFDGSQVGSEVTSYQSHYYSLLCIAK
jgi:hypothetical protein